MKITLNVLLAVVLFCSVAFAGDMGSGGRPDGDPIDPGTITVAGDMGSGGRSGGQPINTGSTVASLDTVIVAVELYLGLSL